MTIPKVAAWPVVLTSGSEEAYAWLPGRIKNYRLFLESIFHQSKSVVKPEALARRHEKRSISGEYFEARSEPLAAPVDLVSRELLEISVRDFSDGELYCPRF